MSAHGSNNGEQGGNTEQQLQQTRNNLLKKIDALSISISEQQNFIVSLKYVIENTWMSAAASREALIDSFPPDVLLHPACLKLPLLFRLMRETFQMLSIPIEARQGLYVPQAVADALYASDNVMLNTAHRYLSDYRYAADGAARGQASTVTQDTSQSGGAAAAERESVWRRVDAANRRFDDEEKYSGIMAESPNLAEARNAYLTYCNQKGFPRPDRVRLVSCILKGPALNYWNMHIDGKPQFAELGAVFLELESQQMFNICANLAHQPPTEMTIQVLLSSQSSRMAARGNRQA